MSFFLDIFNKNEIIIVFDIDGNIWFSMRDIF